MLSAKTLRIFDVNLRQSFYNTDVLRKSFEYADIIKLNEQELIQVSFLFDWVQELQNCLPGDCSRTSI